MAKLKEPFFAAADQLGYCNVVNASSRCKALLTSLHESPVLNRQSMLPDVSISPKSRDYYAGMIILPKIMWDIPSSQLLVNNRPVDIPTSPAMLVEPPLHVP